MVGLNKNTTKINIQQAMKELKEAEQIAFMASLKGLTPAEKHAKRQARRSVLKERRERQQAERRVFEESLERLAPAEKKAKRQERQLVKLEQCAMAQVALQQTARESFTSALEGLSEEEREIKWLEGRAIMQKRMTERKAARRVVESDLEKSVGEKHLRGGTNMKFYDDEELAKFQATLKGLGPRAKQIKWQLRIKKLRADIQLNGGGSGIRKALRHARKQRDLMARRAAMQDFKLAKDFAGVAIAEQVDMSKKKEIVCDSMQKKAKYGDEELAVFHASLEGLLVAELKQKWQTRIKELRSDIEANGPGGGNRKALRLARLEMDKLVKAEQVTRKNKLDAEQEDVVPGKTLTDSKIQQAYTDEEFAAFRASLEGLPQAEIKQKWQTRMKKLRAEIQANGPGGGNRKALRLARQELDKLAKCEQVPRKNKFVDAATQYKDVSGGESVGNGKKMKSNVEELASFEASLKGMSPAAKKLKWQARIKELRADIMTHGLGGGNGKALELARNEKARVAREALLVWLEHNLSHEEKLRLVETHEGEANMKVVDADGMEDDDIVFVSDSDFTDVSIKMDA
ncbi:hypothetical protein MPSEU_000239400 [Mayamaea pseudoterrestris]|nr:hypothetical protein MPSEU_000239400 [Mayamaea pseudoterrestris]